MIFYYSATGNTGFAARYLGRLLKETTVDILKPEAQRFVPEKDETLGIMFPIYCWGIPPVVTQFLEDFPFQKFVGSGRYLWGVCTCGDETGTAMRRLNCIFEKRAGKKADALWSVIMPNTYVMLPGFDVDSPKVERSKLESAPHRLDDIAGSIMERASGIYDVTEGSLPRLRSAVFPVFKKWGVHTGWWHVSNSCIGCGKCAAKCPAKNIRMVNSRPEWGKKCFSCCACYHICPTHAVSYANFTRHKSQYIFPES